MLTDENIDSHLLFSLQIIAEILSCDGKCLLIFREKIMEILQIALNLKSKDGYKFAAQMIKNCLESLTNVYPINTINLTHSWDELSDFTKHNPIREWSKPININNSKIDWHVPSSEEKAFAQQLLDQLLSKELSRLKTWRLDCEQLNREEVNKSLLIIFECLHGASSALSKWKLPILDLVSTLVPFIDKRVDNIGIEPINFSSGGNICEIVATEIRCFLQYLLENSEDDTQSFGLIIKIYLVLLGWTKGSSYMKVNTDHHRVLKQVHQNKLIGNKCYVKRILVNRIRLQHEVTIILKWLFL